MPSTHFPHRILVIANETCPCEALQDELCARARQQEAKVLIVAPALNRRVKHWMSDVDEAVEQAGERLRAIVVALNQRGLDVEGVIGDTRPLQAIDDALVTFPADELVVSTHPPGKSHWLEKRLLDRVPDHFDGPVSHFVSAYGAAPAAA